MNGKTDARALMGGDAMDLCEALRENFAAKAAKVDSSTPSTTSWNGVRDLIAEQVGLESGKVYVTTISKPGNVRPRFFQSKAALGASLLVAMHTDVPENVPATVAATKEIAAERGVAAVVATREGGEWSVVAILRSPGEEGVEELARCYPEAVVLPV